MEVKPASGTQDCKEMPISLPTRALQGMVYGAARFSQILWKVCSKGTGDRKAEGGTGPSHQLAFCLCSFRRNTVSILAT